MKNINKNQMIIIVIAIILVGGISFYVGTKVGGRNFGSNKVGQFGIGANGAGGFGNQGQGGANGNTRMGRNGGQGGMMGGLVSGEVLSKDATSITVKLRDGGSKIILIATSTAVQKTTAGTIADIAVGNQITATGPANADGSINANSIQQRLLVPTQGATQGAGVGR